jgi:nicotinate-nucleotide pyrophosphorylase
VKGTDFRAIAETGVDYISSSALVRAAPPLDFHMKIVRVRA